jgi:hypothetical protein
MSWGDCHRDAFAEQAEACSRADHLGEEAALSETAKHSERFWSLVQEGISRLAASDRSLGRAALHHPTVCGACGAQRDRSIRCALLCIADL